MLFSDAKGKFLLFHYLHYSMDCCSFVAFYCGLDYLKQFTSEPTTTNHIRLLHRNTYVVCHCLSYGHH